MAKNEVTTFVNGDRRIHYIEVPDDEVDAYIEELRVRLEELKAERDGKPGFIK